MADLESQYIRDRYLDNDPMDLITEDECREICSYIHHTHDADVVRALLRRHPDLCRWPEFPYCSPVHCCILNLLVQAGLDHQHAMTSLNRAVVWEDWRALASLAKVKRLPTTTLFGIFLWERALRHISQDTLNFMVTLDDPSPFLPSCSYVIQQKAITYENAVFVKPWSAEEAALDIGDVPLSVEDGCRDVDESDTPSMIRSLIRLCPDILHDLKLTPRYRRPSVIETLSALGCSGLTYEGHICVDL
ncbi:uncharacterized protein EV422DRAFT_162263 [Fimicolochytrium jonesii]|uniref:uncharacterized protein n=1 Tax=Fimicolochytrium jonesii TaxID=1396493 RepID=UPI0022FEDF2E|nr:uncharacterized protein EV422DRAFT_162263 [Fimicolochytrium jonesii]KAI8818700.1 hypothetical protein EV422DRAFT_162263 [Fimicolochytrium jonesii]